MRNFVLSESFLAPYYAKRDMFPDLLARSVYLSKYSRRKADGTNETWTDTIRRVVEGSISRDKNATTEEAEALFDVFWTMQALPPGRGLWVGGVEGIPAEAQYNCYYTNIDTVDDWGWLANMLMLGGGVGVGLANIHNLPVVQRGENPVLHIFCASTHADVLEVQPDAPVPVKTNYVEDSRQGWVNALVTTIKAAFAGNSIAHDVSAVRRRGSLIKTFGGIACGPGPLVDLLRSVWKIVRAAAGRTLTSVECLDITNFTGKCIKAGNVRRSALIQLGNPLDEDFRNAKKDWAAVTSHRHTSNNSLFFEKFSQFDHFDWGQLARDNAEFGEPGIVNAALARLTDPGVVGINPCQPAWATVLTPEGIRTFADIDVGSTIWSGQRWTKVLKKWSTGEKQVNAYKTRAGTFYGTENHRVVSQGVKTEVQYAESIDTNTFPYEGTIKHDPKHVMDGLVFGDGTTHKATGRTFLVIGNNDQSFFQSEVAHLIGSEAPTFHEKWYNVETSLEHLPLTYNREIPKKYFRAQSHYVCSFLRGLYSANGSVVAQRVTLKASSFKVIEQTQQLLSSLGISSYYTVNKSHPVEFENGVYDVRESYDLNISTIRGRERFQELIGFIQPYKQEKLKALVDKEYGPGGANKNSYGIVEVVAMGVEEVFDITVEAEEHTYWTGGLLVSNCGEQFLYNKEACNLVEYFPAKFDGRYTPKQIIKLITRYAIRQRLSDMDDAAADEIGKRNMRIGVGLGGICDFRWDGPLLRSWFNHCVEAADSYADELGVPRPRTKTTTKPSGTISLLNHSAPGLHADFDDFYVRNIRLDRDEPMAAALAEAGVPSEPDVYDNKGRTLVFSFPMKLESPTGTSVKNQTLRQQFERQLLIQENWADNAVSSTISFDKNDLGSLEENLRHFAPKLKSVSCLPSEHGYAQAPYMSITEDAYIALSSKIDNTHPLTTLNAGLDALQVEECSGGICPVR